MGNVDKVFSPETSLHAIHRVEGRSAAEIARSSYELAFDRMDANPDLMRILAAHRIEADPRVQRFIEEERLRWQHSLAADYRSTHEAFGTELEAELAAEMVSMLHRGAMERYLDTPPSERPKTRERLIDGLVRFTLHGFRGLSHHADRRAPTEDSP